MDERTLILIDKMIAREKMELDFYDSDNEKHEHIGAIKVLTELRKLIGA